MSLDPPGRYATSHAKPAYCNVCREALSGVTSHGLSCEVCKFKSHKRCAVKAINNCKWTTLASVGKDIIEDDEGVREPRNPLKYFHHSHVGSCLIHHPVRRTSPCLTSGWKGTCPSPPSVPSATRRAAPSSGSRTGAASGVGPWSTRLVGQIIPWAARWGHAGSASSRPQLSTASVRPPTDPLSH